MGLFKRAYAKSQFCGFTIVSGTAYLRCWVKIGPKHL
ncbi:hypothetical protein DSW25_04775 [Sulfitobacter donghicola DSW-25 = KCTC 12864 = JCM 14565]|uniref:Uncharacterized protein n=1 Tax=Sulfitobacter donghicola DSW-25 = KCTC 12864 = JCM 14565 TaxID=1300350 RepID=A0A073IR28_9RHOB|nr:hypothetical protein DSW25_04775 [Sulfitobacter donghicola DSW-25 = KCTC 12864 = JCM 14565]